MTVKTNSAGYEIYGLIAEVHNRVLPIGFILTAMTDGTAAKGAKECMLNCFLQWFVKRCPQIRFTGSDKDPSEINAMHKNWPDVKHQLCYWHGLRYIGERLTENRPPPLTMVHMPTMYSISLTRHGYQE